MLFNALRSCIRAPTLRIPAAFRAPYLQPTRGYKYDSNKGSWMHTIDSIFSPWSDEFSSGVCWSSAVWFPTWIYTFIVISRGRYNLFLHMERAVHQTVRAELGKVRVIFEDQAQWEREERWDPQLRSVDQEGEPVRYNFVKVRMSDAVTSALGKEKEVES